MVAKTYVAMTIGFFFYMAWYFMLDTLKHLDNPTMVATLIISGFFMFMIVWGLWALVRLLK